jgi:OmpA-OmpF porin, OOP family
MHTSIKPWLSLCIVSIFLACMSPAHAQSRDLRNSKDHPMLSRFPDSHIAEYAKNFNEVQFAISRNPDGSEKRMAIEGDATKIRYFYNNKDTQPSPLQLQRNYQNAIKSIGGEVVFERKPSETDGGETTLKATINNKEVWVQVMVGIYSAPTQSYDINIVERAAMQQVVSANKLLDELNAKGFVTLYINFDTNKWDIKSGAQPTLAEVAKMIKSAPKLAISIEGHTDNIGAADANKTLSANRARSVMNALVTQGVAAAQLGAVGFGAEKPIADNRSEEGRAKNRRVELVKKGS